MRFSEIILEATAPYSNPYEPSDDIGLIPLSDFLSIRNSAGKYHADEVYATNIENMNRPDRGRSWDISFVLSELSEKVIANYYKNGIIITIGGEPSAVIKDGTLYYTQRLPSNFLPITNSENAALNIKFSDKKRVKYVDEYVDSIHQVSKNNLENYPKVMSRFTVGDEEFTIRTKQLPYENDRGATIIVFNDKNLVVGYASDEWGATLIRVADEYRGKGIGQKLGGLWYKLNPSFNSGGFSPSGKANSAKVWADRVRTILSNGWYSEFVKNGEMTQEDVREILASLPERKKKTAAPTKVSQKPEPLIYSDGETQFVIYDKKYFDEQDEKYIYAHGFLRDSSGKTFIFALDYEPSYKQIATYVIFQIAYNHNEKLYVKGLPSDHVELDGIEGITIDNDGYASLTGKAVDLPKYMRAEQQYRKAHDQYDEIYNSMLNDANSKWK